MVGSSSSTSSSASRQGLPSLSRVAATASKTRSGGELDNMSKEDQIQHSAKAISDFDLSFKERAVSAAGAAFLSAIIVNPLDVAKVTDSLLASSTRPLIFQFNIKLFQFLVP